MGGKATSVLWTRSRERSLGPELQAHSWCHATPHGITDDLQNLAQSLLDTPVLPTSGVEGRAGVSALGLARDVCLFGEYSPHLLPVGFLKAYGGASGWVAGALRHFATH